MDGFTVSNANSYLNTGSVEHKSAQIERPRSSQDTPGESFANALSDAMEEVNGLQKQADIKMQEFATGKNTNIADVKIAVEKADIALKLMVQVRNKVIDAYHEVMKMQV